MAKSSSKTSVSKSIRCWSNSSNHFNKVIHGFFGIFGVNLYMHTVRLHILCLSFLAIAAGSCKKDPKDNTEVTFTNQTSEKVTLDIYVSENDYGSNSNVMLRKVLSPNENTLLPGSTFNSGGTFYM